MSEPTLEDLICLNQEIAAFVKAGIPLEIGLKGLSGSFSSRLGQLSKRLSERMESGLSLSAALAEEGPAVSRVYTSVMEAGLLAGRLPKALESLTASAQVVQEIRTRMALAFIYPAICVVFAYTLFCIFVMEIKVSPRMVSVLSDFTHGWPLQFVEFLQRYADYFTMVVPALVLALVVLTYLLRKTVLRGAWKWLTSFRWIVGKSLDWAQFTELLALQIERGAPLPTALTLSADATENRRLRREMVLVSSNLTEGESLADSLKASYSMPPLVRWMIATGEQQGTLGTTLRHLRDLYRRQALRRAAIIKIWFPVVMTIVLTAIIGFSYTLAFVIPLRMFLSGLAHE